MTVNAPPDTDGWGVVTVLSASDNINRPTIQLYNPLNFSKGKRPLYYRFFRDTWTEWREFVFSTPPQEFDLPLAEGVTALQPCAYWKNQFEEVTIYGCTYGEVTEGDTIATLPEGFRPDHPVEWPASFTGDGSRVSGTVFISESGIVSIHTPAPAMSVVFAASFLAAG